MSQGENVGITGVHRLSLTPHPDARGSFTEIYRRSWIPQIREMVQANLSHSRANVLRGLHFHRHQADFWCLAGGSFAVGLLDLRQGSPTERRSVLIRLSADDGRHSLYIPPGVAHGFYAETDVQLIYLVDEYYSGEDEFGIAWNDPDVGIPWPGRDPILSERDMSNPALTEVIGDAPPFSR